MCIKNYFNKIENVLLEMDDYLKHCQGQIAICDKERIDMDHVIELNNFSASDGYKISKKLQSILQKRRYYKNEIDGLNKIKQTFHNSNKNNLQAILEKTKTSLNKHNSSLVNKKYTPRSDLDIEVIDGIPKLNI